MKIKDVPAKVKAGPDAGLADGEFLVYPSTFTRTPDSYGDVVAKGAFLDTIAEWEQSGNVLPGLYMHRMDDPDYIIASALEMSEDDHGLLIKGMFDLESDKGRAVYRNIKAGRLSQLSFAYDTLDEASIKLDDGTDANELRKLKMYEFSFVLVGANQDTSVVALKTATEAVAAGIKAGRVLAQKHIDSLRAAQEALGVVIAAAESSDEGKAAGHTEAKPDASDEGREVKSSASGEELRVSPSADSVLASIAIIELEGRA